MLMSMIVIKQIQGNNIQSRLVVIEPANSEHPPQPQMQITHQFLIHLYHNMTGTATTHHILQQNPVLQILAIESNLDHQITIIRLSDGVSFLDCTLSPPNQQTHPKIHTLIRLKHFQSKIETTRISKLRIQIKQYQQLQTIPYKIGQPNQLTQYLDNCQQMSLEDIVQGKDNTFLAYCNRVIQRVAQDGVSMHMQGNQQGKDGKEDKEDKENKDIQYIKVQDYQEVMQNEDKKAGNQSKDVDAQMQQILTGKQILSGRTGLFAGRLLRTKMTTKQTKQGQLTVLILGFMDKSSQLIRVTMAGRTALKQSKQLKISKCYNLMGLQAYQTDKMLTPQIKIKQKQLKISEITNTQLCDMFEKDYHRWDHQIGSIQAERVDVIGVVEEIDDQALYIEDVSKRVVRLTVRNIFKTVKVSFWSDQIQAYKNANIQLKQAIIFQDIKKKKNKFLDYTYQSQMTKINPNMHQQYLYVLPQNQQLTPPCHLSQISSYIINQSGTQSIIINMLVFLTDIPIQKYKIVYKICSFCKKKLQFKSEQICKFCSSNISEQKFEYKYNWAIQFSDFTSTITTISFDLASTQLINKNAKQLAEMSHQQIQQLIQDQIKYCEYNISIQKKNLRFILRNIHKIKNQDYVYKSQQNIQKIKKYLKKNQ